MMTMRWNLGLVCAAWLVAGLAACGGGTNNPMPDMTTIVNQDLTTTPADMTGTAPDLTTTPGDMAITQDMVTPADMALSNVVQVGFGGGIAFSPASLTITVNQTVNFVWVGSSHSVVSGTVSAGGTATPDNKFCNDNDANCGSAPVVGTGHVYSHKFTTAGTYPYFCAPHAGMGMKGTIVVN